MQSSVESSVEILWITIWWILSRFWTQHTNIESEFQFGEFWVDFGPDTDQQPTNIESEFQFGEFWVDLGPDTEQQHTNIEAVPPDYVKTAKWNSLYSEFFWFFLLAH